MTRHIDVGDDMGMGLAIGMVLVAALGGLLMVAGALDKLAAVGFALAVIGGIIAVWAVHAY